MFDGHFFTTNHANVNSQEHRDTREDTLVEVGSYFCFTLFYYVFFSICLKKTLYTTFYISQQIWTCWIPEPYDDVEKSSNIFECSLVIFGCFTENSGSVWVIFGNQKYSGNLRKCSETFGFYVFCYLLSILFLNEWWYWEALP